MLKFTTAGESHGPALISILEGAPAGLPLLAADINADLARRQQGYGRGRRMQIESDAVEFLGGVRAGYTIGSPIAMMMRNRDWENWREVMDAAPAAEGGAPAPGAARKRAVTRPRPGHADLVDAELPDELPEDLNAVADESAVRILDPAAEAKIVARIDEAKKSGDTLGGVCEVVCTGLPIGLGSHVSWDRKLDGRIGAAMMSIPAVKGVGIGIGFDAAQKPGSAVHDEILSGGDSARTANLRRRTNRAGGLEGGMTTGEPLVVRVAMKPISTLMRPLATVEMTTGEAASAVAERSDVTAVPAMGVIAEAMLAFVVAQAMIEKFGGDSMREMHRNFDGYVEQIRKKTDQTNQAD